MVCEAARAMELVKDLKSEVCLARFEAEATEPVNDRSREFFSAKLEAIENEPVRDLKSEFLSSRLEAEFTAPARDLNNETFSAKVEDGFNEASRPLPTPFAVEPASVRASLRDLRKKDSFVKVEAMFTFVVTVVEQERGLELQISFPELTLATMLPMVDVMESLRVLKMEFFSARLDARLRKALRDLKKEDFSARFEAWPREAIKDP